MSNGRNKTFRITSFLCSEPRIVFLSHGVRGLLILFPLLQPHWTLLSLKNTSAVSEPMQTAVHCEAVLQSATRLSFPSLNAIFSPPYWTAPPDGPCFTLCLLPVFFQQDANVRPRALFYSLLYQRASPGRALLRNPQYKMWHTQHTSS